MGWERDRARMEQEEDGTPTRGLKPDRESKEARHGLDYAIIEIEALQNQLAAEKALADRLWEEWRSWVGKEDRHLTQSHEVELETAYRKARGL